MMPGSDANRGLLSRRSTVTTAGSATSRASRLRHPPRARPGPASRRPRPRDRAASSARPRSRGSPSSTRTSPAAGEARGEHLASLVLVVVDRLLAHDDEVGPLLGDKPLEDRRDDPRIERALVTDEEDAAVGAHASAARSSIAALSPPMLATATSPPCASFQAQRLLDGDLVERVHLIAHPVGDDAGPVGVGLIFDSGSSTRFTVTSSLRGMAWVSPVGPCR